MQGVTVEEVAVWLCEKRCPMTLVELYSEWKKVHHEVNVSFLELATTCAAVDKEVPLRSDDMTSLALDEAVMDILVAYGKQRGEAALNRAVKQAKAQIAPNDSPLMEDDVNNSLRSDFCPEFSSTAIMQEKQLPLVGILKQTNSSNVDNRTNVAVPLSSRLQNAEEKLEQTVAVLSKGLPTLISAVDPMRKDILIPIIRLAVTLNKTRTSKAAARLQLLTLYSRPNHEHRAAIAEAWAMTLRNVPSPVLEYDIVPELFNLANAKYTERHILCLDCVMRLAPLLGKGFYHTLRESICQGLLRPLSEDEARTVRCNVVQCITELWPISSNDIEEENEKSSATVNDSLPSYVELILRLALHDSSGKVRRCALQSLREHLLLPMCTPPFVSLTRIVPIFLSCLERESAVMGCGDAPMRKNTPLTAVKSIDVVEGAVTGNIWILANLIEEILRHAVNSADTESNGVSTCVLNAYLRVVLPSAYALVFMSYDQDSSKASICAVASALATIVPSLRSDQWKEVRNSLETFFTDSTSVGVDCGDADVRRSDGWRERRLCFLFTYFTQVAGEMETAGNLMDINNNGSAKEASTWLREMLLMDIMEGEPHEGIINIYNEELADSKHTEEMRSFVRRRSETNARLDACATSLVWFAMRVDDSNSKTAAVISSMLWSLAESPDERQRMLSVDLVERVSGFPKDDKVREMNIWPPLLVLMNDTVYEVKAAAMRAALSMVKFINIPAVQEKIMTTVLMTVEAEGCSSRLGIAFLRHWCSLLREMPAEPRETYLYPQLASMILQLTDIMSRMEAKAAQSTVSGERRGSLSTLENHSLTEEALEAVLAVLANIPRCAVVTPQPVTKYLIPSIQRLMSLKSLPASSRSQLLNITKEYTALLESSKGPRGSSGVFNRMRNELKKHF